MIEILSFAIEKGFSLCGLIRSPIQGPKGNIEFLVWLGMGIPLADEVQIEAMIDVAAPPAEIPEENKFF